MPKVASMQQKEQFIELRAKGKPFEAIANEIGISKPTLIEWAKEFKLQIANLKAFEIESIQHRYFMNWKKRSELLNTQLEQINKEIEKRDLTDVTTEKLVEMQLKLLEKLREEQVEITFKEEQDRIEKMNEILLSKEIYDWKPE